jgi:hypothetical protein
MGLLFLANANTIKNCKFLISDSGKRYLPIFPGQ